MLFKTDRSTVLSAIKMLAEVKITPIKLLRYCTDVVVSKIQSQIQKQRE